MLEDLKKFDYKEDKYNKEYKGYTFKIKGNTVFYREGKITPKYNGVFVSLWKKKEKNMPYSYLDDIDYLLVNYPATQKCFLFTKKELINLKILTEKCKGKMGFRLFLDEKNKKYIHNIYNKEEAIKILYNL